MTAPRHLFGPVPSRRLGRSLGIDLTPRKLCCEDCVFCQIGPTTTHTLERREWVDTAAVLAEFDAWAAAGGEADYATLSGYGEPTLHTRFGDVLRHARDRGFKTALLSNGGLMHLPEVRRDAAASADIVKVTLSAWNEDSFRRLHRPALGLTFERLLEGEQALRDIHPGKLWVEVMLVRGVNDAPEQVEAIADAVATLRADAVHLNTLTRPSLSQDGLHRVSEAWLHTIAPWFTPVAEVPAFKGKAESPLDMTDDALMELLVRHPLSVAAWAKAAGIAPDALEARLAPLAAAGRVAYETDDGVRMVRAAVPSPFA